MSIDLPNVKNMLPEDLEEAFNDLMLEKAFVDNWLLVNGLFEFGTQQKFTQYEQQIRLCAQNINILMKAVDWKNVQLRQESFSNNKLLEELETHIPEYSPLSDQNIQQFRTVAFKFLASDEIKNMYKFLHNPTSRTDNPIKHHEIDAVRTNSNCQRRILEILTRLQYHKMTTAQQLQIDKMTSEQQMLSAALNRLATLVSVVTKD